MANLKDIGYGIGKYLEASDASAIPGIGTTRKNLDLLNFKVAVNNAYSLYNFKDGMIDAYQTEGGVDTATSTNDTYDSTDKYYSPSVVASTTTAFTSTGAATWTCPAGVTSAEILIVAGGGGGGGKYYAGGGGAGGIIHDTSYTVVPAVVYDLSVGAGGAGGASANGGQGVDSVWNVNAEGSGSTYTALGGGKGSSTSNTGYTGGSGGGSKYSSATGAAATQTSPGGTATGYGNAGGQSSESGSYGGGGGGGALTAGLGDQSPSGAGGPGGNGRLFSSFTSYGVSGYFGGGGGGGAYPDSGSSTRGAGGYGGGGAGASQLQGGSPTAQAGTANTGGGGGGGAYHGGTDNGGAGGSGVILIKTSEVQTNMTLISNAQTAAQADPEEGRLMIYEEDVDSVTPGTDIKGYVSRDNGATYTETPLVEDTVYESIAFNQGGNDSYTKLLLHCDGANDGTTFTDSSASAHTVTAAGNAHTDTAIKKFGTASLQLDGTGDWLSVPDSEDWNFAAGDFTIDFWTRFNDSDQEYRMIGTYQDIQNFWRFEKRRHNDSYGELNFRWTTGNSNNVLLIGGPLGWTDNTWYHLAIVRYGNVFTMYQDGINVGQQNNTTTLSNFTSPITVGVQDTTGTGASPVNGYMDEVRISKGVARWTENFTPATRLANPYDDGTYTQAATKRILSGAVDISGQPAGSNMKYKVETLNEKNLKLHGASLLWA